MPHLESKIFWVHVLKLMLGDTHDFAGRLQVSSQGRVDRPRQDYLDGFDRA